VPDEVVGETAAALRSGEPCVLLLGGGGMRRPGLEAASRVAQATGARLLGETFPARHERGAGLPAIDRLAYLAEFATAQLGDVLPSHPGRGTAPVSLLRLPGKPSFLVPADCQVHLLAEAGDDVGGALTALADLVAPGTKPLPRSRRRPALPEGDLTGESAAAVIGALLPEGAIVSDEANTSGVWLPAATAGAPAHDWLTLTGGSIGQGLPLATGAAIASPGRRVLALEADGSAMYTISALWTHAGRGSTSPRSSSATGPTRSSAWNWAGSARNRAARPPRACWNCPGPARFHRPRPRHGRPGQPGGHGAEFARQLRRALAEPGPHLIEAVVPPSLVVGWIATRPPPRRSPRRAARAGSA
jgi:acetolactate synthase-1/2/3 large subunit